jgi:soluble lytic murein transglycosylase
MSDKINKIKSLVNATSAKKAFQYSAITAACLCMTNVSAQIDVNESPNYTNRNQAEMMMPVGFNSTLDTKFAMLRDAAKKGDADKAQTLALELSNYDIPSYVEYYRLYPQIMDKNGNAKSDFPDAEIRQFLIRYTGEAIADRMRNDWLLGMAIKGDWANFALEYPKFILKDDTQLACYNLIGKINAGENVTEQAKEILVDTKDYGGGCLNLIQKLSDNKQLSQTQLKLYAVIAAERKQNMVARQIYSIIGASDDSVIRLVETSVKDYRKALLDLETAKYTMGDSEKAYVYGSIAYAAAQNLSPDAMQFYAIQANIAPKDIQTLSPLSLEWRVRMALRSNNWQMVKKYIADMPSFVRKKDNTKELDASIWDYWYARAAIETGDKATGMESLKTISQKFDFYGQLATEDLGKLITIPNKTLVEKDVLAKVSHRKGIQQSKRFYDMNMRKESQREWNWETRFMSDKELLAMAEIGATLEMMDRSIYSADKTKQQHNFNLRFPTPMFDVLSSAADSAKVDLAFVYGLTRQESRFIKSAKSGVGASGLMQVMPATASYVAKKIGMAWPSGAEAKAKLADINVNTLLGASYISMVLGDLDYHYGMAAAAYNAGPGRPKKWRSMLNTTIDGAAYAESIPFAETRDYVKNVLSNTVYYRGVMTGKPQSIKDLTNKIGPKEIIESELP